jgi:hypothetical protein
MRIAYVHELEDKVNRLEAVLHSLGRRVEDHIQEHEITVKKPPAPYSTQTGYTPLSDVSREAISQHTESPTADSSWQYVSNQRDQHRHLPEPMSVRSVITDGPEYRNGPRPRSYTSSSLTANRSFSVGEQELPPYDLVYNLVDLFFKHINPWSPILDRKTTFHVLFGGSRLTEDDRVLLNAIVATTLRFSGDARLTATSRKQYHDTAKTKVLFHCLENPSVSSMQALAILAIDTIGTSCSLQGMNLLAFVSRSIVQLGLGNELTMYLGQPTYQTVSSHHLSYPPQPSSWIEEEGRRRLVWMLYILDRYTTLSTSSTFTFPDNDLHLRLPCTYDLFSRNTSVSTRWPRPQLNTSSQYPVPDSMNTSPANLGSFSYHCEVLTILSRIHEFLSRPVPLHSGAAMNNWRATYQHMDGSLTEWLHSLPGEYGKISQLCHSDPGSKISNWIMLHAAFVLAVLRLHSVAAYPASTSMHFQPSFNAMQRCLGAVESLREIAQDTINNSMLDLLGPPFAFSLWTSARLLIVDAATRDGDVDPKIRFFISTLEAMGQYWQIALTYAKTLERLVREGSDAVTMSNHANSVSTVTPSTTMATMTPSPSISTAASAGYSFPLNRDPPNTNHHQHQHTSHPSTTPYTTSGLHPGQQPRSFRTMRKRSYEIGRSLHSRRSETGIGSGHWWTEPNSATTTGSQVITPQDGEVEYLDVFTFFDYPKVLPAEDGPMSGPTSGEGSREGTRTPGAGVLQLGPAPTGQSMAQSMSSGSHSGAFPSSAIGGAGISVTAGSSRVQSPVFAMPVRESDWLGFQPPHE